MELNLEQLETFGLTRNEASTFISLLEIGQTKTGALVKKTGLFRVQVYDALESLIKKGLASYVIKENIKYFQASDPENLIKFLDDKKKDAESLLPQLKILQKKNQSPQQVELYEGLRGLKAALSNMLSELTSRDDHCVFASGNMEPTLKEYYYRYQAEKKKKKILTRGIVDLPYAKRRGLIKATYAKIRSSELGPIPNDTWIYKNKVLIVTYTANPPVAVLFTSQETADSYKKIFESMWKTAKPLN